MTKQRACATNLFLSRRTIMAVLPASAIALAAPMDAAGTATDPVTRCEAGPILGLFASWQALRQEGQHTETDEELDQVVARMAALETQIFAQPSRTPHDLAVKVVVSQDPTAWEEEQPLWQEIRQLVGEV